MSKARPIALPRPCGSLSRKPVMSKAAMFVKREDVIASGARLELRVIIERNGLGDEIGTRCHHLRSSRPDRATREGPAYEDVGKKFFPQAAQCPPPTVLRDANEAPPLRLAALGGRTWT